VVECETKLNQLLLRSEEAAGREAELLSLARRSATLLEAGAAAGTAVVEKEGAARPLFRAKREKKWPPGKTAVSYGKQSVGWRCLSDFVEPGEQALRVCLSLAYRMRAPRAETVQAHL
jgi:hypothetical protein